MVLRVTDMDIIYLEIVFAVQSLILDFYIGGVIT